MRRTAYAALLLAAALGGALLTASASASEGIVYPVTSAEPVTQRLNGGGEFGPTRHERAAGAGAT